MDKALVVQDLDDAQKVATEPRQVTAGHRASSDPGREGFSLQVVHHKEGQIIRHPGLMNLTEIRMGDVCA
jgi:hypothetical protein